MNRNAWPHCPQGALKFPQCPQFRLRLPSRAVIRPVPNRTAAFLCFAMSAEADAAMQDVAADAAQPDRIDAPEDSAEPMRRKRTPREWTVIGEWNHHDEQKHFIESEILKLAKEQMQLGGITKLLTIKTASDDLWYWKVHDRTESTSSGSKIIRYRCPFSARCKCPAMLRLTETHMLTFLESSNMHTLDSHGVEKDTSKHLKWQQKEGIAAVVRNAPLMTAAAVRRGLHRSSPEKRIDAKEHRSVPFFCLHSCDS